MVRGIVLRVGRVRVESKKEQTGMCAYRLIYMWIVRTAGPRDFKEKAKTMHTPA